MTFTQFLSTPRVTRTRLIADRLWRQIAVVSFTLAMVIPVALLMGFRFIATASVPRGLWFVHQGSVSRGAYALICLPSELARLGRRAGYLPSGHCPGDALPLMKRVVALPGDRVEVSPVGVRVDGILIAGSKPQARDSGGNTIARVVGNTGGIVAPGTLWVLGDSPKSWDSRYFGAIPNTRLLGLGTPVITTPFAE